MSQDYFAFYGDDRVTATIGAEIERLQRENPGGRATKSEALRNLILRGGRVPSKK